MQKEQTLYANQVVPICKTSGLKEIKEAFPYVSYVWNNTKEVFVSIIYGIYT